MTNVSVSGGARGDELLQIEIACTNKNALQEIVTPPVRRHPGSSRKRFLDHVDPEE